MASKIYFLCMVRIIRLSFVLINHDFSMELFHSKSRQVMILRNPSLRRDFLFITCSFFLFILFTCEAYGQGVKGMVRDHTSYQPIEDVQLVFLKGESVLATVKSNKTGEFSFNSSATGSVQLMISAEGF